MLPSMSPDPGTAALLDLVGLTADDEDFYLRLLRSSGSSVRNLSEASGIPESVLEQELRRFADAGLVRVVDGLVRTVGPEMAFGPVLTAEAARVQDEAERLDVVRHTLPTLVAEHASSRERRERPVQAEVVEGGDFVEMFRGLCDQAEGDLCWLRPDQWQLSTAGDMNDLLRTLMEQGRSSRAIYPAGALEKAPDALRVRADLGEHVRLLDAVPSRMAMIVGAAVLLPEQWGVPTSRRLLVREPAVVDGFLALFDTWWDRSVSVPGLDEGSVTVGLQTRQLLLQQLAAGAKDENIARALGMSLRTVRRRVAELMDQLGVESRFQAGVEAVRRGWI